MSKYKQFTWSEINGYPLRSRHSKVTVDDFARPFSGGSFEEFLSTLPRILAAADLLELAHRIADARDRGKGIIWGLGGHVIKVGLAPLLIELMRSGFATAFAVNGSVVIHDFEIGFCGKTSEEVERTLNSGSFGMARETGECLNEAINRGAKNDLGLGESIGCYLDSLPLEFGESSLLLQAYRQDVPVTVHVAYGTDIIHNHPLASGASIGHCAETDFRILAEEVSRLHSGGAYLNVGSAVILPEVFLKAVSLIRNSGLELADFTTANFDFIQHYRPARNVVTRPILGEHGKGYALTGHHELMVPLLAAILLTGQSDR